MKIKFYIPEDEQIPSELRLKVDDTIDVFYSKVPGFLGYEFKFMNCPKDKIEEILTEISKRMCCQSEDRRAKWVESMRRRDVDQYGNDVYILHFKISTGYKTIYIDGAKGRGR